MKKILNYLLCLALLVCCFSIVACNDDKGNASKKELGFTYELVKGDKSEEDYLKVTGYNVSDEVTELVSRKNFAAEAVQAVSKIEVPAQNVEYKRNGTVVGTYPVKEIAESAFSGMLFVKEVVIPSNIETIGNACLSGCVNLEKLTVPFVGNKKEGNVNSKKTLAYLFGSSEVTGTTSTTVKYNSSGSFTVYVPNSLKTVVLTGSVVGEYAFYGLSGVEEVVLPAEVTEYGAYAFANMTSLYKFAIGSNVTKISESAFSGCTALVNPKFDDAAALTYIGNSAFSGCALLGSSVNGGKYVASENLTYIGANAFNGCTALETVDLSKLSGKTVTIRENAFKGLTALKKVVIPTDVTKITFGNLVFAGCTALEKANVTNHDKVADLKLFDFDYAKDKGATE